MKIDDILSTLSKFAGEVNPVRELRSLTVVFSNGVKREGFSVEIKVYLKKLQSSLVIGVIRGFFI